MMGGSRFLVVRKIPENTIPRSTRGRKVCRRKWHMAKSKELATTAAPTGMKRAREERRNPRKMACVFVVLVRSNVWECPMDQAS